MLDGKRLIGQTKTSIVTEERLPSHLTTSFYRSIPDAYSLGPYFSRNKYFFSSPDTTFPVRPGR
ncbi:hypothetical protein AGR7B_pAt0341 [Agrobacterium deltaense RV3]|nr:hypothetical protein AGR7B_pAt0341 [Agrobacterium deltaense RV3]